MVSELQPLIHKVWRHCEDKGTRGRTATLKIKFADFEFITRSRTIPEPIDKLRARGLELPRKLKPTRAGP
jgi:DNA polymerase-4